MTFDDKLKKLVAETVALETIEISDIPEIDLYMDQVTTFMETKLATYKRNEDEKILTKTMINNYAKAKLFPAPIKKRYTRNHIMLLIIIYHLKSILSISDISLILKPINEELQKNKKTEILNIIYDNFVKIQKSIKQSEIDDPLNVATVIKNILSTVEVKDKETVEHILIILTLATFSNTEKRLAEKVVDNYFNIL